MRSVTVLKCRLSPATAHLITPGVASRSVEERVIPNVAEVTTLAIMIGSEMMAPETTKPHGMTAGLELLFYL